VFLQQSLSQMSFTMASNTKRRMNNAFSTISGIVRRPSLPESFDSPFIYIPPSDDYRTRKNSAPSALSSSSSSSFTSPITFVDPPLKIDAFAGLVNELDDNEQMRIKCMRMLPSVPEEDYDVIDSVYDMYSLNSLTR
jgi:hypothetical protein